MTNFYAIDTETSGFDSNEPIQIAVALFENGSILKTYNEYYMPTATISFDAWKTHGLSEQRL